MNRFILPILWYVLKVLDPPVEFLSSVKKLCEDYLWGTRRHWVKRLFVYGPAEYGGLGVKDPEVQILGMRIGDAQRVFTCNHNNYFLNEYVKSVRSLVLLNESQENPFYENMRRKFNRIKLRFKSITKDLMGNLGVQNICVFHDLGCDQLLQLGLKTVDCVLDWNGSTGNLTAAMSRKLHYNISIFQTKLKEYQDEVELDDSKPTTFVCDHPVRPIDKINDNNRYAVSFFGVYNSEGISNNDLLKMKGAKWVNISLCQISNAEKDVTWRLWHNSLLSFSLATRMGLSTSPDCPFCAVSRPTSFHMVHCQSTQAYWNFLFDLLKNMGLTEKRDKLNGFEKNKLGNFIIFLAHNVLYNRILYCINSGRNDFKLIQSFKQRISERLLIEFGCTQNKIGKVEIFKYKWNNGIGLFEIRDSDIVIFV